MSLKSLCCLLKIIIFDITYLVYVYEIKCMDTVLSVECLSNTDYGKDDILDCVCSGVSKYCKNSRTL